MRLIDADELKKHKVHSEEFAENVVSVCYIDWQPTIEAEPVKHIKWYYPPSNSLRPFGSDTAQCPKCGFFTTRDCGYNYCPNCGAKVDKEEEEE